MAYQPTPMSKHIAEVSLLAHPGEPEGKPCPGCKKVGLPGVIPCAPRVEALRLLALAGAR
jgi:hypothetical protein